MTDTVQPPASSSWRLWCFLAVQPLVLAALAAAAVSGSREFDCDWQVPPLREEPLRIRPLYDCPDVVSDEQLHAALLKMRPRLYGPKTLLADVDHALRFWGPEATFDDPQFASGADLLRLLTDSRRFAELYESREPSALYDTPYGVCCRVKEGLASTSHTDHTLACLSEVGTPLSCPVVTPNRTTTFRAMIEHALHDFNPCQTEYEWSAKIFALFLPPTTRWRSAEGQMLSFDLLADRIMREELPHGVCAGTHRLFTLTAYLRLDEEQRILSPGMRTRVEQFLKDANKRLVANQHPDGFWNTDWPFAPPASAEPTRESGDQLHFRIIVTGHALEYWAIAPKSLQPPRKTVVAGAGWILRTLETLPDDDLRKNFSFLTHAVRALTLWRGHEPFEAWQALAGPGAGQRP